MALVIVSGLPCAGRSRRAQELRLTFESRISSSSSFSASSSSSASALRRVVVLTDDDISNTRTVFDTQAAEKPARAAYLSLVVRHLAPDALVLADGGAGTNIKGFRYQLWCAAREAGVRCISVLVATPPGECTSRNERRRQRGEEAYAAET
jgi:protein KTI12